MSEYFLHMSGYVTFISRSMEQMVCERWRWLTGTCLRMSGRRGQRSTTVLAGPPAAERIDWQLRMRR